MAAEKEKLRDSIRESREAQEIAMKAHEKALEDLRVARAREERLRRQMDLLDRRAEDAIAVESREIEELEQVERSEVLSLEGLSNNDFALHLSPSTWGAFEGLPFDYWDSPVGSGVDGTAVTTSGSS